MKKILSVIVVVVVTLTQTAQITAFAQETDEPAVNAQACVLYCVDDGKVYFSVNENKKMKPASTTKLMTSLITLEYADSADKVVTFTKDMTAEGSSMYLKVGEKVKLSDLAAGMMMASGNDAQMRRQFLLRAVQKNFRAYEQSGGCNRNEKHTFCYTERT